jgi:hypothetical protein
MKSWPLSCLAIDKLIHINITAINKVLTMNTASFMTEIITLASIFCLAISPLAVKQLFLKKS